MFSNLHSMPRNEVELATQALNAEADYRFPSFGANDAVTIGLSLRKRFRASSRHQKGKGLVITVQTVAGHVLFSCTVGDLSHFMGVSDVSLDSWAMLESMVGVVKRTGHSSYYVEKGMNALGKTAKQIGLGDGMRVAGGAFPIWLENAPCCPIAIVACYSGSSQDDHNLVVATLRDYLNKMKQNPETPQATPSLHPLHVPPAPASETHSVRSHSQHSQHTGSQGEWLTEPGQELTEYEQDYRPGTQYSGSEPGDHHHM